MKFIVLIAVIFIQVSSVNFACETSKLQPLEKEDLPCTSLKLNSKLLLQEKLNLETETFDEPSLFKTHEVLSNALQKMNVLSLGSPLVISKDHEYGAYLYIRDSNIYFFDMQYKKTVQNFSDLKCSSVSTICNLLKHKVKMEKRNYNFLSEKNKMAIDIITSQSSKDFLTQLNVTADSNDMYSFHALYYTQEQLLNVENFLKEFKATFY